MWLALIARFRQAAGIEPLFPLNPNPMMANDFGSYCVKTFGLPRLFDSPGVPYSPLESPQSWRNIGDARVIELGQKHVSTIFPMRSGRR
jgi:hypothetical protein